MLLSLDFVCVPAADVEQATAPCTGVLGGALAHELVRPEAATQFDGPADE